MFFGNKSLPMHIYSYIVFGKYKTQKVYMYKVSLDVALTETVNSL